MIVSQVDFMKTLSRIDINDTGTRLWVDIIWINIIEASLCLFCNDAFISSLL